MDTTTRSEFDIKQLRNLIQKVLTLPDGTVRGSGEQENNLSSFITADILLSKEVGQSRCEFTGYSEVITTTLLTTVSISCYGNNAYRMAAKLRTVLQSSSATSAFKVMSAGIVRMSDVRNLTAIVGADYEERGQFDCIISHGHVVETPLAPIERVAVTQSISVMIKPQ